MNPMGFKDGNYKISGSLSEAKRAAVRLSLAHSPSKSSLSIEHSPVDIWFEVSYQRFRDKKTSSGNFMAGYFGADYVVN